MHPLRYNKHGAPWQSFQSGLLFFFLKKKKGGGGWEREGKAVKEQK